MVFSHQSPSVLRYFHSRSVESPVRSHALPVPATITKTTPQRANASLHAVIHSAACQRTHFSRRTRDFRRLTRFRSQKPHLDLLYSYLVARLQRFYQLWLFVFFPFRSLQLPTTAPSIWHFKALGSHFSFPFSPSIYSRCTGAKLRPDDFPSWVRGASPELHVHVFFDAGHWPEARAHQLHKAAA